MPSPKDEFSVDLLKVTFGKRTAGNWAITALDTLSLKPQVSSGMGFYAIADDLVISRPASFGPTSYFLGQSIVPIVAQVHGENILRCIGTGFFISCSGLMITAAHVISDPIERKYGGVVETNELTWHARELTLGVMIALNPVIHGKSYVFREIQWAGFLAERTENPLPIKGVDLRLTSDTAICKVAPLAQDVPHQPLAIVQSGMVGTGMKVGKKATAIGYGAMQDVELEAISHNVVSSDFSFDLHVSTGKIFERFPENAITREVPAPGACFSASLRLPGGMSGSPIFDDEQIYVHGVVSRGWVDAHGVSDLGFGSMLAHSMHVPIRPLENKTLLQLHGDPEHGFAKLSGPGI